MAAYYGDIESGDYAEAWALLNSGMTTGQTRTAPAGAVPASRSAALPSSTWACGPRTWPLAFLLYAEGVKNPPRADPIVSGYRRRVTLEPGEIERIPAMMRVRPVVLAAWGFCLGRWSAAQATRAAVDARQVAETVGPRVVAAFRSPAS